ncbi:hypothetical protein AOCH_005342 [Aspergillus ochraceoroseus]|uniref:Uncharacterized protein n=1 Tax=Aspergillus ochraceoroseus TaxID=138278 RepID=A0A0F8V145_9EURO|nr:hypothetical protein AOCH_005342 [Aspergillus ochraceoroseus]
MSRPYQNPSFNSSNSNNTLSPNPNSDTPVSFRTNVNRSKTKRWVEAKKYSYDGDDWGEDEYGEYEYDDDQTPPAASQTHPATVNQGTADTASTISNDPSQSAAPSTDRSRGADQALTAPPEGPAASASSPASIVRPADLYRRMREEQRGQQHAPGKSSSNDIAPAVAPSVNPPPAISASAEIQQAAVESTPEGKFEALDSPNVAIPPANEISTISLPDVKRLSGFSPQLFTQSESTFQKDPEPEAQSTQLQHNPSLGFRSAVNQAFDVPETPSTVAESVVRSNSDSTAGISPIITRRATNEDKTPTIEEESNENPHAPSEDNIAFKPGHRRDLSLPSPGNSPSRTPVITNPDASPSSMLAQISTRTPSDPPQDIPELFLQQSSHAELIQPPPAISQQDLPAPLNVQINVITDSPVITSDDHIPAIIPSMSTDNSPQDTENDRLRKEIIRSLSRENTPSDQQEQDTPPQTARQDSLIPSEYETYWSEQQPTTPLRKFLPLHSILPRQHEGNTPVAQAPSLPPAAMPGQFPLSQESIHHEPVPMATRQSLDTTESKDSTSDPGLEKPILTIVPPFTTDSASIASGSHAPEVIEPQTAEDVSRAEEGQQLISDQQPSEPPTSTPSASIGAGLLGFKDILGIQSSEERVKAFNRTRDQFATIDTGLSHWIQVTIRAHPEHADVVARSSKLPVGDPKPNGHQESAAAPLGGLPTIKADSEDLYSAPTSKPWTVSWNDDRLAPTAGEEAFVRRPAAYSDPNASNQMAQRQSFERRDDVALVGAYAPREDDQQQHCPAGPSDSIQGSGEHIQPSRPPSNNNRADCKEVEQSGAKPLQEASSSRNCDSFQDNEKDDAILQANNNNAASAPRGNRPDHLSLSTTSPQSQSQIIQDLSTRSRRCSPPPVATTTTSTTTAFDHRRGGSHGHLTLGQLPSVSSLGAQEADLGPPPSLSQKLAQDNYSLVSLPSDIGDVQPRNPGGTLGARTSHSDYSERLSPGASAGHGAEQNRLNGSAYSPGQPPSSTRPQSTLTIQYDWSRPPEQISSSSRDPASHRHSSSRMEKLKSMSRFRGISMGSNQPDPKAGQSSKKPFNRLTGLFGRSQHKQTQSLGRPGSFPQDIRKTQQYLAPVLSQPTSRRITRSSVSSFDNQEPPVSITGSRNNFQGQRPPVDGYFARESPESFSLAQAHEHVPSAVNQNRTRLSYTSPTDHARLSPQSPRYHPLSSSPQQQYHLSSPRLSSPLPSPVPRTPPSRGRSQERTYAQDLHLRSRSPKTFAPRPEERDLPNNDPSDPAFNLGTFRTNPRTSRVGDQELPWKITIPGESEDTPKDSSATWRQETTAGVLNCTRLPSYQEDAQEHGQSDPHQYLQDEKRAPSPSGHPAVPTLQLNESHETGQNKNPPPPLEHPHRSGARAINTFETPVELPVTADNDSSEEIIMSSTSYPGQEWRPLGFSEWDHP